MKRVYKVNFIGKKIEEFSFIYPIEYLIESDKLLTKEEVTEELKKKYENINQIKIIAQFYI